MPKFWIRFFSSIAFITGLGVLFLFAFFSAQKEVYDQVIETPNIISPVILPEYSATQPISSTFPIATASAIFVLDRQSMMTLYERNSTQARSPASTAKLMTALVARKLYKLDEILQIKEEAFALGSVAHFAVGERLSVESLLYALLLPSGNDAALVFATHHPFGYSGFVNEMNTVAKDLQLDNTIFENPSGLDIGVQASSARDLGIIANEVMKDEVLRRIVGTKSMTIADVGGKTTHQFENTHELLGQVPGVVGIKTGTTELAGENLITEVDRDGHQVIIVLFGSQNRYNETKAIIEWVFRTHSWVSVWHKNQD